ncbi:MAG: hypothetical protein M1816_003348 [Peltula sp. TS41687]|nr:MAG: hypothetical protein M1816_003348 [Peltula sp. TS41687]
MVSVLIGKGAPVTSMDQRDHFSEEDRQDLSTLVPPHVLVYPDGDNKAARVDPNFLKYDMDFRHGLRCFAEDLRDGRFDPVWLEQAAEAMEERAHGDFDDFKARQFELF